MLVGEWTGTSRVYDSPVKQKQKHGNVSPNIGLKQKQKHVSLVSLVTNINLKKDKK